jgi:hypothetical protein
MGDTVRLRSAYVMEERADAYQPEVDAPASTLLSNLDGQL